MEPVRFSMAGEPRGKGRPRTAVRKNFATIYTDEKTRAYEASVSDIARQAMGGRPAFRGALSVSIQFRMPIPQSESKKRKAAMAAGEIPHITKPDADNMAKAILDGMGSDSREKRKPKTPIVFRNDSQIVRLFTTKVYSERPGVDVQVIPLGEPE